MPLTIANKALCLSKKKNLIDTKTYEIFLWLGIKNDYRTLLDLDIKDILELNEWKIGAELKD